MAWSLTGRNFGADVVDEACLAGDVAESGNIGGSIAIGFFQFGGRKVVAAGNGDVFKVRPEFDFFFAGVGTQSASHHMSLL